MPIHLADKESEGFPVMPMKPDASRRDVIAGAMIAAVAAVAAKVPHQVKKQLAEYKGRELIVDWYFTEMRRIMHAVFRVEIEEGTPEFEYAYKIAQLNVDTYNKQQELMRAMCQERT